MIAQVTSPSDSQSRTFVCLSLHGEPEVMSSYACPRSGRQLLTTLAAREIESESKHLIG